MQTETLIVITLSGYQGNFMVIKCKSFSQDSTAIIAYRYRIIDEQGDGITYHTEGNSEGSELVINKSDVKQLTATLSW